MEASIRPPLEFIGRLRLKMEGKVVDEVEDVSPPPRGEKIHPNITDEEYVRQQKTRTYKENNQNLENYNLTLAEIANCISMERMTFGMDSDNLSRALDHLSQPFSQINPCIKGFSMLLDKELAYCETKRIDWLLQWLDMIRPMPIAGKPFEDWVKEAQRFASSWSLASKKEKAVWNTYI